MADVHDVPCVADGDVAGWGVVVSLLVTSVLSVVLSIFCAIFLWLEYKNKVRVGRNMERAYKAISAFLMELSVNQLVMGFALYVSAMRWYGPSNDPHAILAIRLSNLSAVSQLQIIFVAYHPRSGKIHVRLFSSLSYGFAAGVWGIVGDLQAQPRDWLAVKLYGFLIALVAIPLLWELCYLLAKYVGQWSGRSWTGAQLSGAATDMEWLISKCLTWPRGSPYVRIVLASLCFILNGVLLYFVSYLKFIKKGWCDLNAPEDNRTTFGQILPLVMLGTLLYSGIDAYLEAWEGSKVQDIQRDMRYIACPEISMDDIRMGGLEEPFGEPLLKSPPFTAALTRSTSALSAYQHLPI